MARRIFLVGYMGSGKSSFGRRLAAMLGWGFLDTDHEIERRAGMTIPEIFDKHGEEWFRALEGQVIEEAAGKALTESDPVAAERDTVVALGGGAVCREGVMEMLSEAGTTVYLKTPEERLVRRMSEKGRAKRPKIAGMNDAELLAYIEKTLPEREKYYNKANFALDCDAASDEIIVRVLLEATMQQIDIQNVK
jgi:shikimate kinase